jgi:RNA recognition motif-containing protein
VHRFFHLLGAGSIEEVRVTRDKGFGFVRYSTHEEAALAIQTGNGQLVGGRQIKVLLSSDIAIPINLIPFSPIYQSSPDILR